MAPTWIHRLCSACVAILALAAMYFLGKSAKQIHLAAHHGYGIAPSSNGLLLLQINLIVSELLPLIAFALFLYVQWGRSYPARMFYFHMGVSILLIALMVFANMVMSEHIDLVIRRAWQERFTEIRLKLWDIPRSSPRR